jgi:hypothetical protein
MGGSMVYIHYGSREFDRGKFKSIENIKYNNKPSGGLWASPIEGNNNWKDWCEREHFRNCRKNNSFKFVLKGNANVLRVNSCDDLEDIPQFNTAKKQILVNWVLPNFEQLLQDGIDAIEYNLSGDGGLYWAMYGWDCDSILIMNPDVIEVIKD